MTQAWYNIYHRPKTYEYDPEEPKLVRWGERKHNGHRLTLIKDPDGKISAFSSKHTNIWSELPEHIRNLFATMANGTVLDGELISPNDQESEVHHLRSIRSPQLGFCVFAAPYLNGEKYFGLRRLKTEILFKQLQEYGFQTSETLDIRACDLAVAEKEGFEGYVLKANHYFGWYKYKVQKTCDVVVQTAITGMEGKFANRWGTLICAVYRNGELYQIANVSKGKDALWRDLPLGSLAHRVCEIAHSGMQSQGKLRFSRFIRWRDDKLPEECTYEQFSAEHYAKKNR